MMMAWKLAPAIAGGNIVCLQVLRTDAADRAEARQGFAEHALEGVVNAILGRGESVGNALINHPKINMISITGDVATGKKVLQAAAKSVKRTHLGLRRQGPGHRLSTTPTSMQW